MEKGFKKYIKQIHRGNRGEFRTKVELSPYEMIIVYRKYSIHGKRE